MVQPRMEENRRIYERRSIGARYAKRTRLEPDEEAVLHRFRNEISGGRILDLGVGGGRTTPFLLELSDDYVGVDYSFEMIERCRQRFPAVRFEVADARDLSRYADCSFDFVLFSYNGLDCVGHDDRLVILGEVRRILKPGALFAFSSHNRNFRIPKPWDMQHLAVNPLRHPMRFGKRAVSYPVGIANYWRHARDNRVREEYCITTDTTYMYSSVTYKSTPAAQQRQLESAGFCDVEAVSLDGRWLSPRDAETLDDPWIHYVARRAD